MDIHIVSSTDFMFKGTGVHSAFKQMIEILNNQEGVKVIINGEGKGDIFHSHSYGLYYFFKSKGYKGRRIHTVHTTPDTLKGSIEFAKLIEPFSNLYFKLVYNRADVCIAISPMVEQKLKSMKITSKIIRLDNPLDLNKWEFTLSNRIKGRAKFNIDIDKFVVLGVGQIQARKGVEEFIEIASRNLHMEFVWVGGRPFGLITEGLERIKRKIANATPNVKFIGLLEAEYMPIVYAASDVLLFTSYQENSPLAPLEAAASGLPVVFRNIKEYTLLYQNPYISASNNTEFSNLLNRFYSDEEFLMEAKKISKNLIKQFDKNEIKEKLVHLYQQVLQEYELKKTKRSIYKPKQKLVRINKYTEVLQNRFF